MPDFPFCSDRNQAEADITPDGPECSPRSSTMEQQPENVLVWFKNRNGDTLQGALAFVPWILQMSYFEGKVNEGEILLHRGTGAILVTCIDGFTALTESLATRSNAAELLSACFRNFFTPLIDLIIAYRGDVIKFAGDGALCAYFPADDDTQGPLYDQSVPPHGTYGLPDIGPSATSVLRAVACCIETHKQLNMFQTGVDGIQWALRLGIGFGDVSIFQVGGIVPPETHVPRFEYLIAGPAFFNSTVARMIAKNGQSCCGPAAWQLVSGCVVEGPPVQDKPNYHLVSRMNEAKYTFPTIKHAAQENDNRSTTSFSLTEVNVIRRYSPTAVFKQIECGTLDYVNEMRNISAVFVSGSGIEAMSDKGARTCQDLMASVQRCCYAHEGTVNKFTIDESGVLFLLVFGLPPLVHTDDPTRAVLACFDMVKVFARLNIVGRFAVATGRSYCGVCGSASRMEYTVLGDNVNHCLFFVQKAPPNDILCDEETRNKANTEIVFNALTPLTTEDGTTLAIFGPVLREPVPQIGVTLDKKIKFPWRDGAGSGVVRDGETNVTRLCSVKGWNGMEKIMALLGTSSFDKAIYGNENLITPGKPLSKAPEGSPFADGGAIVLEGPTGMGHAELAEHLITHAGVKLKMMPLFGTMGPRPGDSIRLGTELLRSCLGIFRHLDESVPPDDAQAMSHLVPSSLKSNLPVLTQALKQQPSKDKSDNSRETLKVALDVVIALVQTLLKRTSLIMLLDFDYGTSLFPKSLEDRKIFWEAIAQLSKLLETKSDNPLVMVVTAVVAEPDSPVVEIAQKNNTLLTLSGLSKEGILSYMANILGVTDLGMVPHSLRDFVFKVTRGNPLYVMETIQQLIENQNVAVNVGANGAAKSLECKDLDQVKLYTWSHTRMVGGTVCQVESLDPLECAVLKMSTCFLGDFSLPDLAASTCSTWSGAVYFDFLRILRALRHLVELQIIDQVKGADEDVDAATFSINSAGRFLCDNLLFRSVAGSMVLESQKKSVKRQALIDRALSRSLPQRMEVLKTKRAIQHIPWPYEQAFKRMM